MTETKRPAKTGGTGLRAGALGVSGIVVLSAVLMGPAISLFFNTPVMASTAGAAVPLVFVLSMIGILFTPGPWRSTAGRSPPQDRSTASSCAPEARAWAS
jgi:hypothetical protein